MTEQQNELTVSGLKMTGDVSDLIELARPLEERANALGIYNVFDDGGYRDMLMLTLFGLRRIGGRLGDDAIGPDGKTTYELKTINLINTKGERKRSWPGVTTEHTLSLANIQRYRKARSWIIGLFRGNVPLAVYEVRTSDLEPYFSMWERDIRSSGDETKTKNNPKIPMWFVRQKGILHLMPDVTEDDLFPKKTKARRAAGSRTVELKPANKQRQIGSE